MPALKVGKSASSVKVTPKGIEVPLGKECEVDSWPSARHSFGIKRSKDGKKITLTLPDPSWTNNHLFIEIEGENLQAFLKSSK